MENIVASTVFLREPVLSNKMRKEGNVEILKPKKKKPAKKEGATEAPAEEVKAETAPEEKPTEKPTDNKD